MADLLLNEVDADIRAEKLARFWQQWRKPIAFLCVALVLGTAGEQIWQHYRAQRGAEWFSTLTTAQLRLSQGRVGEAVEDFTAVANSASGDTKTIAQLWAGRALMAQGKSAEAVAMFKAGSAAKPSLWADLACLRLASLDATAATSCLNAATASPLKAKRQLWGAAIEAGEGKLPDATARLNAVAADETASDAERAQAAQWAASLKPVEPKPVKAGE